MQIPLTRFRGQFKPPGIPRINWTHPLAAGLVLYAYDIGNNNYINLVNGVMHGPTLGTAPANYASPAGYGTRWNALSSTSFLTTDRIRAIQDSQNFSWATAVYSIGNQVNFARPFCRTANNGLSPFANWDVELAVSGNQSNMRTNVFTSAGFKTINSSGFTANTYSSLMGTASPSGVLTAYFNGIAKGTVTGLTFANSSTNDNIIVAGTSDAAVGGAFLGFIYYGAFWSRALSAGEALAMHNDPYGMLIYPQDRIVALGKGTSFVPAPPQGWAGSWNCEPGQGTVTWSYPPYPYGTSGDVTATPTKGWITKHALPYRKRKLEEYEREEARIKTRIGEKEQIIADLRAQLEPPPPSLPRRSNSRRRALKCIEVDYAIPLQAISAAEIEIQMLLLQLRQLELKFKREQDDEEALLMLM